MEEPVIAALALVAVSILLILIKVPIAIALGVSGILGIWYFIGFPGVFEMLRIFPYSKVALWDLIAVPLFIAMGYLAAAGGVTSMAYSAAYKWLGKIPGALAQATVLACGMFAACSGSSSATAGTMGRIAVPEMLKYKYDKALAAGVTCCAGTLGVMIPPSIIFVIYGSVTGESIGKLLMAGILPGILTITFYWSYIALRVKHKPELAPRGPSFSWSEKLRSVKGVWGILLLAVTIIGGIYSGIFTATEAAGAGAFVALLIALTKGRKGLPGVRSGLEETARTTSMVFLIFVGSALFSFALSISGASAWITNTILGLHVSKWLILALILCIYIPLGMIIDSISMLLITLPTVYPIITNLGFNGIWFGVLICKLDEIAMITPPIAANLYVLKGVVPPEVSLEDIMRGCLPFIGLEILILATLIALPQISLTLPSLMK